jgi:hypothetical protein
MWIGKQEGINYNPEKVLVFCFINTRDLCTTTQTNRVKSHNPNKAHKALKMAWKPHTQMSFADELLIEHDALLELDDINAKPRKRLGYYSLLEMLQFYLTNPVALR